MGDLLERTKQQKQDSPKENINSHPKLPWWKALRRASNESSKSAGNAKPTTATTTPKEQQRQQRSSPPPPVSEICIPTHCLQNVSESPQDYFDRMLKQRGYSTKRTRVDERAFGNNSSSTNSVEQRPEGQNEAHQAMANNHWKALHAVLTRTGPQLLLQTDHTGRTPLMYVEPDDWIVWLQFLETSILDRYWPDPNAPNDDDDDDEQSSDYDCYSDMGSAAAAEENAHQDSFTSLEHGPQPPADKSAPRKIAKTTMEPTESDILLLQEQKNQDDAWKQKCFQAALEARG